MRNERVLSYEIELGSGQKQLYNIRDCTKGAVPDLFFVNGQVAIQNLFAPD